MITEADISHEVMKKLIADGHTCGVCKGGLSVAWGGAHGYEGYILRCATDINHNTINRHDMKREKHIAQIKEVTGMDTTALMKMDEKAMIERISMAKFPQDLTVPEKKMLAQVAISYGFDPLMGEVMVYQGRPFVSIDGRYRMAQETNKLDGVESRPATKEEKETWQIPEGDYFFRAEVRVKGASNPFVGWGRVRKQETTGGKGFKPVETNPQRMAEKRAEVQALRKAFHIPLPSAEDIVSDEYVKVETEQAWESVKRVDESTSEVIEGEVVEQEPAVTPPQSKSRAVEGPPEGKAQEPAGEPDETDKIIMELSEKIDYLVEKKQSAWYPKNLNAYLKSLTKREAPDWKSQIKYLSEAQVADLIGKVSETVELAG